MMGTTGPAAAPAQGSQRGADELAPEVLSWIGRYADAIGAPRPDRRTVDDILRLAGAAAGGSARQSAPIACWLAGAMGLELGPALRAAEQVGAERRRSGR